MLNFKRKVKVFLLITLYLLVGKWIYSRLTCSRNDSEVLGSRKNHINHYAVFGWDSRGHTENILSHVIERQGMEWVKYSSKNWNFLWVDSHSADNEDNLLKLMGIISKLNHSNYVNMVPKGAYEWDQTLLARNSPLVPRTFKVPEELQQFLHYSNNNPGKVFFGKNRGGSEENQRLLAANNDVSSDDDDNDDNDGGGGGNSDYNEKEAKRKKFPYKFIQELVQPPLLIAGHKFELSQMIVITSLDPLRIYASEDLDIRFAPTKFHPFQIRDTKKYVVSQEDGRPVYPKQFSLDSSVRRTVLDTLGDKGRKLLSQMEQISSSALLQHREQFMKPLKAILPGDRTRSPNMFRVLRMDYSVDKNSRMYLQDIRSYHWSSHSFYNMKHNRDMYFLLHLAGILEKQGLGEEVSMPSEEQLLGMPTEECQQDKCLTKESCEHKYCWFCRSCIDQEGLEALQSAYREQHNQFIFQRLYPKPIKDQERAKRILESRVYDRVELSPRDHWMHQWYLKKCLQADQEPLKVDWCR